MGLAGAGSRAGPWCRWGPTSDQGMGTRKPLRSEPSPSEDPGLLREDLLGARVGLGGMTALLAPGGAQLGTSHHVHPAQPGHRTESPHRARF